MISDFQLIDGVTNSSSLSSRFFVTIGDLLDCFEGVGSSFLFKLCITHLLVILKSLGAGKWPTQKSFGAINFILWPHVNFLRRGGVKGGGLAISLKSVNNLVIQDRENKIMEVHVRFDVEREDGNFIHVKKNFPTPTYGLGEKGVMK